MKLSWTRKDKYISSVYSQKWFHNIAGDLANGTSVTHMVNKMEVVQYLKKIYGPKMNEREQKSIKGTLIDFLDTMIFSIFFFIYSFYYYISFL